MHLPGAVDTEVLGVHPLDDLGGRRVGDRPRRGRPRPVRVVAARGDLDAGLGEGAADRLDPVFELVLIDVGDDQREGRSSSAAKKADALFKIAFARRSSRFSRSRSASRVASSVVVPGRWPWSTSAWRTQLRSVSALMPSCCPIRFNAPVRVAGSRRASTAIRVARSRSSSGYFLGAAMTLILTWIESLHQTRGGTMRPTGPRSDANPPATALDGERSYGNNAVAEPTEGRRGPRSRTARRSVPA